jgi:protein-S-isoprenylcysteine O-methyltransferase Ste14
MTAKLTRTLAHIALALMMLLVVWLRSAALRGAGATWTAHEIAGMAIAVPAFCLWALARVQLGESFAIGAEAKTLVTHGLYARFRDPVYVFGGLLLAGILVFIGRPVFFLAFLILIPVQWIRARKERAVLEATFGDEYRRYRQRTWF